MYVWIFLAIFAILTIIKMFVKSLTPWNKSYTCLIGKTVIVTGANTGIGYWSALDFAKRGARVILACKNLERANEAKKQIISATGNTNIDIGLVDFTSLESVRRFCKIINERESRLDVLVNNVGASHLGDKYTDDGLQILWHVNHLSPFLLTHLLIDKLKKSAPSRVVIVASSAAKQGNSSVDLINTFVKFHGSNFDGTVYAHTKTANILFARELARRLSGTNVNVHALHPGVISTRICRRYSKFALRILQIAKWIFIFKTPEEGAQTTIYCAVSKDLDFVTGKFYEDCRQVNFYKSCLDMNRAKELWEKCEVLVKIKQNEKIPIPK